MHKGRPRALQHPCCCLGCGRQPKGVNPSMLWRGYLIGCGRYSKQERALSGSRGSSRSFSVRAGAVRIAAEPENVRQPHVLLEIHSGGEGGELDPCAGIMAPTAKREQISPHAHALPPPAQPSLSLPFSTLLFPSLLHCSPGLWLPELGWVSQLPHSRLRCSFAG